MIRKPLTEPRNSHAGLMIVLLILLLTLGAFAGFSSVVRGEPVEAPRVILRARMLGLGSDFTALESPVTMFIYVPPPLTQNDTWTIMVDGVEILNGSMVEPLEEVAIPLAEGRVINNLTVTLNGSWMWSKNRVYVLKSSVWDPSDLLDRDDFFLKISPFEWGEKEWNDFWATTTGIFLAVTYLGWRAMVHAREKGESTLLAGGK